MAREVIIKDTHRGLWYVDGVLTRVLEASRYAVPAYINFAFYRRPKVEVTLVDVRERDLTIKGQEILTADKVSIRVSIIVQFRVVAPRAALHEVADFPRAGLPDSWTRASYPNDIGTPDRDVGTNKPPMEVALPTGVSSAVYSSLSDLPDRNCRFPNQRATPG